MINPREPVPYISRDGLLVVSPPRIVQVKAPEPAIFPCVVLEIGDAVAVREIDPLLRHGDVMPFWGISDMVDLKILALTPAPDGAAKSVDCPLDLYEFVVKRIGVDPVPVESPGAWAVHGQALARDVLRDLPARHGMSGFRGQAEARLRMAEAEASWYGASSEQIAEVTGRECVPRRSLRPTGGKAASLDAAFAGQRAESERSDAEVRARLEEERRPNTSALAHLRLTGVEVPLADIGVQVPRALGALAPVWIDDDGSALFVWRDIVGLPLPVGAAFAGCMTLQPSAVIPCVPVRRLDGASDATVDIYHLTIRLRRKFMTNVDRGPIGEWTTDGVEAAKAFVTAWAHVLYSIKLGQVWIPPHIVACVVRGHLVAPARAARLVFDVLDETHSRLTGGRPLVVKGRKPVGSIPASENLRPRGELEAKAGTFDLEPDPTWAPPLYAGSVAFSDVAQWCADAAAGGEVEAGSLLATRDPKKGYAAR